MTEPPSALHRYLGELKRRRVFRVAGAYAAVSFVVWQAADIVLPALHVPEWVMTLVVVLGLLGFPFALLFAWLFDVGPGGIRRTPDDGVDGHPGTPAFALPILMGAGALLAMGAGGAFVFLLGSGPAPEATLELDRSVAVLPFANLSGQPENEYFSDGVTDDLIGRLQRVGDLTVISRTTVMSYKDSGKPMREIAAELGVAHVVEGTVRRQDNQLRINAKLVDAARDRVLWDQTFDREISDVFQIQAEIAERIASELRVQLSGVERDRLAGSGTESVVAYDQYLKALQLLWETPLRGVDDERSVIYSASRLLREALEADPRFAEPYAWLSYVYTYHVDLPPETRFDSASALARRAIEMAPDQPHGYAALGRMQMEAQELEAAAASYQQALERNPSDLETLVGLSELASGQLRYVDAMGYALRAQRVAPDDAVPEGYIAGILATLGDFGAAEAYYREALRKNPAEAWWLGCRRAENATQEGDRPAALEHLARYRSPIPDAPYALDCSGNVLLQLGELDSARDVLERYLATLDGSRAQREALALTKTRLGYIARQRGAEAEGIAMLKEAEAIYREIRAECPQTCRNSGLGGIMAQLGRADEAIALLQRAVETGWNGSYPSDRHPLAYLYAPVASDPRYQTILGDLRADFDAQRRTIAATLGK